MNTVVINADRLPPTVAGSINGPLRFPAFIKVGKAAKDSKLMSAWLRVGPNHGVTDEDIEVLRQNEIAVGFLSSGVIEILRPEPEEGQEPTGHSREYAVDVMRRIIAITDDMEWLQESVLTERRADIKGLLRARLNVLKTELETAQSKASGVVAMPLHNAWIRVQQERSQPLSPAVPPKASQAEVSQAEASAPEPPQTEAPPAEEGGRDLRLNLNGDITISELIPLSGIGKASGGRIMTAREAGTFRDFEDLVERAALQLNEEVKGRLREEVRFE